MNSEGRNMKQLTSKELDKRLRNFEKKHPIKKSKKLNLDSFVANIESQLDKLEH